MYGLITESLNIAYQYEVKPYSTCFITDEMHESKLSHNLKTFDPRIKR